MAFSGKKFRRSRCENVEELLNAANASEHLNRLLQASAPTFSFLRNGDGSFTFTLHSGDKVITNTFRLGEEIEMERRDGSKVKVTYTLESDNVLSQIIKQPDGKIAHFRREFMDKETKMTISIEGSDVTATIYYEVVE